VAERKCPEDCPAHSGIVANIKNTADFIEKMEDNHLPHIYDSLSSNKSWLIGVLGGVCVSLVLLVVNLVVMNYG